MQNLVVGDGMVQSKVVIHASTYYISEKLDLKDVNKQIKNETVVGSNDVTNLK